MRAERRASGLTHLTVASCNIIYHTPPIHAAHLKLLSNVRWAAPNISQLSLYILPIYLNVNTSALNFSLIPHLIRKPLKQLNNSSLLLIFIILSKTTLYGTAYFIILCIL